MQKVSGGPGGALDRPRHARELSTGDLVARLAQDVQSLAKAEVQLAKTELRANVHVMAAKAKSLAVAGCFALGGFLTLLAAAVLGLSEVLVPWAAALVVGGACLLVALVLAAIAGRSNRPPPLGETRRNLKEDLLLASAAASTTDSGNGVSTSGQAARDAPNGGAAG